MSVQQVLARAQQCLLLCELEQAEFFAHKAVSMSKNSIESVGLLSRVFLLNSQPRRVLTLVDRLFPNCPVTLLPIYLKALLCTGDAEAVLHTLETTTDWQHDAGIWVCKARAAEALQNREAASEAWQFAAELDPECWPAVRSTRSIPESCFSGIFSSVLFPETRVSEGLDQDVDILAAKAVFAYEQGLPDAFTLAKQVVMADPLHVQAAYVYIACLVQNKCKAELFAFTHSIMTVLGSSGVNTTTGGEIDRTTIDDIITNAASYIGKAHMDSIQDPNKQAFVCLGWFCIGSYYFTLKSYPLAIKCLGRAVTADPSSAPAWIAYGHAFSSTDESDQALVAYRTASRLFPQSHLPHFYVAKEYIRMNSLSLGGQFLVKALNIRDNDWRIHHELGVLAYMRQNYTSAAASFTTAVELHRNAVSLYNLGNAYMKMESYDRAIEVYNSGIRQEPGAAEMHSAKGMSLHAMGKREEAIESYHIALAIDPKDTFSREQLDVVLDELVAFY